MKKKTVELRREDSGQRIEELLHQAQAVIGSTRTSSLVLFKHPELAEQLSPFIGQMIDQAGRYLQGLAQSTERLYMHYIDTESYQERGAHDWEDPHLVHLRKETERAYISGTGYPAVTDEMKLEARLLLEKMAAHTDPLAQLQEHFEGIISSIGEYAERISVIRCKQEK